MDASAPVSACGKVEELKRHLHAALKDQAINEAREAILLTNDVLSAAIKQHGAESTRAYQQFIVASCAGAAAGGHALVKCYERDAGISYEDQHATMQLAQGIDVAARMNTRIDTWAGKKWKCHMVERQEEIAHANEVLRLAMDSAEPLPRHNMRSLRRVLAAWPAKAGLGIDLWVLQLWATLPNAALRVLLLIIQKVEEGCMPMQMLIVLIGLLPKPKGGERPVALTSMLYRLIIKLRRPIIGDWEEHHHGHWDAAIKGSSCLRAALARALRMEADVAMGMVAIGGLWDIAAFFDSIRDDELVTLSLAEQFPPQILLVATVVHTSVRAFREGPYVSQWVQPTGLSILAGCGCSVDFTRSLLYNLLDKLHRDYIPMQASTWVDDVAQMVLGPPEFAITVAVEAGAALDRGLARQGPEISPKSKFVASNMMAAKEVQKRLKEPRHLCGDRCCWAIPWSRFCCRRKEKSYASDFQDGEDAIWCHSHYSSG